MDIDPKDLARGLLGDQDERGMPKFCTRHKQCSRALTCEHAHAHKRGVSVQTLDLFQGKSPNLGDCSNWRPRKELNSDLDVPRRKPGSGSRHNPHAPNRTSAREALGFKDIPDLTKGIGSLKDAFSPQNGGRLLPQPPDLQVSRHIRHGRNIKDGDDS